ncbi:MAG TPA: BMP family protein [Gemmatimonadales bacterium]|nr:BMP family protein [Gemmatimonadales bacterium]
MRSLLLAALFLLAACSDREPESRDTLRVALVTPGSVNDAAWNAGAYAGLQWIRDSLFADISHVEARTPGEQEEALRTYAAQGYDLVFGHGFEFQQPAERVSAEFPRTVFAITSGQRVERNVVPLIFRFHEATYLVGMLAGTLTRSNRIGFVGGMELPPVVLGYRGWLQGARAVNPGVDSRIAWLNNFDDPAAGKEAATAMIGLGVDELHHNADAAGLGVFSAALETSAVHVYGANADQASLAPERIPASAVIDLPRAMLMVARDAISDDFKPRVESFGLESGVVRLVTNPAFPEILSPELLSRVQAAADSIIAGTLVVAATEVP